MSIQSVYKRTIAVSHATEKSNKKIQNSIGFVDMDIMDALIKSCIHISMRAVTTWEMMNHWVGDKSIIRHSM